MTGIYGVMFGELKARIWQLWRRGVPMSVIAREIVKPTATVYSYLLYHDSADVSSCSVAPCS